ncbi:hypothetical protein [Kordiimonas sp.]|uniref:hypothetical protein n=1 Tax=Kordiimonas sp. TaxID=1970157 RepID=UPI003A952577
MLANRVRELTTTSGAGDITLGGALAGHVRFNDAFGVGDVVSYVIEDGDNYEIGTGTMLDADTLERTTVLEVLVGGVLDRDAPEPISLSGNARVFCTATAEFLTRSEIGTSTNEPLTFKANDTVYLSIDPSGEIRADGKFVANSGAKISVQNTVDGGSGQGIFLWDTDNPLYGIYTATAGSGRSLSGGTTCASLDGRTSHHIRHRIPDFNLNGFIWENGSEECLMSLTADTGDLYTKGRIYPGNHIVRGIATDTLEVSGGSSTVNGGAIKFFGGSHATRANDTDLLAGGAAWLSYDASAGTATFSSQISLADTNILRTVENSTIRIGSSTGTGLGWNMIGYANNHASRAGDFEMRNDVTPWLSYDASAASLSIGGASQGDAFEVHGTGSRRFYVRNDGAIYWNPTQAGGVLSWDTDEARVLTNTNAQRLLIRAGSATSLTLDDALGISSFSSHVGLASTKRFRVGGTPRTDWNTAFDVMELGQTAAIMAPVSGNALYLGPNWYYDGAYKLRNDGAAAQYLASSSGNHYFRTTASGSADATISWTDALVLSGTAATFGVDRILRSVSSDQMVIAGGPSANDGGNIFFYGSTHPTNAGDTILRSGSTNIMFYDASASLFRFYNAVRIDGTTTFAGDVSGNLFRGRYFHRAVDNSDMSWSAGTAYNLGANIFGFGQNHVTRANDLELRASSTAWLSYDARAGTVKFAGDIHAGDDIVMHGDSIVRNDGATYLVLSGGDDTGVGGNIVLYGDEYSNANDISFRSGTSVRALWDNSANRWNYNGNILTGTPIISRGVATSTLQLSAGSDETVGGNILLHGESHPTDANDIRFRSGTIVVAQWDDSAGYWHFQNNPLFNIGNVTLSGTDIYRDGNSQYLRLAGGNAPGAGGNVIFYGSAHTSANDILFRSGTNPILHWDESAGAWGFQGNDVSGVGALTASGVIKGLAETSGNRPSAATVGAGATMFDTTLGKPIWSDGSQWVDALGAAA